MYTLFVFFLFLTISGFSSVLERKIIGLVQIRVSVSRTCFKSFYHFFLDFIKLLNKGFFNFCFFKILYYNFVLFIFILNNFLFFIWLLFIVFSGFSCVKDFYFIYFLEGNCFFMKVFIFYTCSYKMVLYNERRLKVFIVFSEAVYFHFIFLFLLFNGSVFGFSTLLNLNKGFCFSFLLILFFLFIFLTISKMFRVPFDYIESESEFVNGLSLDFYGLSFLFWSLIEYNLIFINVFFLSVIFTVFSGFGFLFNIFFNFLLLFFVLFIRSVFIRLRFNSCIFFIINIYFISNFLLLIFLLF